MPVVAALILTLSSPAAPEPPGALTLRPGLLLDTGSGSDGVHTLRSGRAGPGFYILGTAGLLVDVILGVVVGGTTAKYMTPTADGSREVNASIGLGWSTFAALAYVSTWLAAEATGVRTTTASIGIAWLITIGVESLLLGAGYVLGGAVGLMYATLLLFSTTIPIWAGIGLLMLVGDDLLALVPPAPTPTEAPRAPVPLATTSRPAFTVPVLALSF